MRIFKRDIKTKDIIYIALTAVFLCLFLLSAFKLVQAWLQSRNNAALTESLSELVMEQPTAADGELMSPAERYRALVSLNPDMSGWIHIDGTNINYPVMSTQNEPEYYLHRDFYKKYSRYGTPFTGLGLSPDACTNTVIFGHNMKDGTMFNELTKYLYPEFYESHKLISFDTRENSGVYEVMSMFRIEANDSFDYWNLTPLDSQAEFEAFVAECISRSVIDTGVTAYPGDKLITLSTCEYSQENGRFVVVARKKQS